MGDDLDLNEILEKVKFDDRGLVPVVTQDASDGTVLMVAYANREAIMLTCEKRVAHYFSRSRNTLWLKGESSGNVQDILEIYYDCDIDTILYRVNPRGPACHTGERTCFYRKLL
jgi:phosphoribosyl-ATP pyrophosphohydrolase/phosphoribosyl-AMP cyclohydrolase